MADEDGQCCTDQETSGALDLSEIFLHGPATSTHMVDSALPSAKMAWDSSPGLDRLIEPFDG